MATTAEQSNKVEGKSKHGSPRLRKAPVWITLCGILSLAWFWWSFTPDVSELSRSALVMSRICSAALSALLLICGAVLWVGDPAYHAISSALRKLSQSVWWICFLLVFPISAFAVFAALFASVYPFLNQEPDALVGVIALTLMSLVLSMMSLFFSVMVTQLTPPFLATAEKPRVHQSSLALSAWTTALLAGLATLTFGVLAALINRAPEGEPNYDMIVLLGTIADGAIGAIIGWHRRSRERLERDRSHILNILGNAVDVLDFERTDSASTVQAMRDLRRLVTPSPFKSHSIASSPYNASYEVTETVKLIEWAFDPTGVITLPESFTRRSKAGRPYCDRFSTVAVLGKEGVRRKSRDFLYRSYLRLLENADTLATLELRTDDKVDSRKIVSRCSLADDE